MFNSRVMDYKTGNLFRTLQAVETLSFSKASGQIPYLVHNGKEYIDSSLIIDYLTEHYRLDPTEGLSPEQQCVSRAVSRMMDESMAKYVPRNTILLLLLVLVVLLPLLLLLLLLVLLLLLLLRLRLLLLLLLLLLVTTTAAAAAAAATGKY